MQPRVHVLLLVTLKRDKQQVAISANPSGSRKVSPSRFDALSRGKLPSGAATACSGGEPRSIENANAIENIIIVMQATSFILLATQSLKSETMSHG